MWLLNKVLITCCVKIWLAAGLVTQMALIPGQTYKKNRPGEIKPAAGQEWPLRQFWLYIYTHEFMVTSSKFSQTPSISFINTEPIITQDSERIVTFKQI